EILNAPSPLLPAAWLAAISRLVRSRRQCCESRRRRSRFAPANDLDCRLLHTERRNPLGEVVIYLPKMLTDRPTICRGGRQRLSEERVGAVRSIELARSNLSRKPSRPLKTATATKAVRFPPPWSIEDLGAAFVVKDSARHKLAYVYYEEEPG